MPPPPSPAAWQQVTGQTPAATQPAPENQPAPPINPRLRIKPRRSTSPTPNPIYGTNPQGYPTTAGYEPDSQPWYDYSPFTTYDTLNPYWDWSWGPWGWASPFIYTPGFIANGYGYGHHHDHAHDGFHGWDNSRNVSMNHTVGRSSATRGTTQLTPPSRVYDFRPGPRTFSSGPMTSLSRPGVTGYGGYFYSEPRVTTPPTTTVAGFILSPAIPAVGAGIEAGVLTPATAALAARAAAEASLESFVAAASAVKALAGEPVSADLPASVVVGVAAES